MAVRVNAFAPGVVRTAMTAQVPDEIVDVLGHRLSGQEEILGAHQFTLAGPMAQAHHMVTDMPSRRPGNDHAAVEIARTTTGHATAVGDRPRTPTANGIISPALDRDLPPHLTGRVSNQQ